MSEKSAPPAAAMMFRGPNGASRLPPPGGALAARASPPSGMRYTSLREARRRGRAGAGAPARARARPHVCTMSRPAGRHCFASGRPAIASRRLRRSRRRRAVVSSYTSPCPPRPRTHVTLPSRTRAARARARRRSSGPWRTPRPSACPPWGWARGTTGPCHEPCALRPPRVHKPCPPPHPPPHPLVTARRGRTWRVVENVPHAQRRLLRHEPRLDPVAAHEPRGHSGVSHRGARGVQVHVHVHRNRIIHARPHTHAHTRTHMHTHAQAHTLTCTQTQTHTHTHAHTHTQH